MNSENLLKMADWLETQCPQDQFNMHLFLSKYPPNSSQISMNEALISCETVGCVIGSIPKVFGVFPRSYSTSSRSFNFDWISLGARVFGTFINKHWDWMFGAEWGYLDNTPLGAAKRIRYFVQNKNHPVWYRWEKIEAPLYTTTREEDPLPIEQVVPWINEYRTEILGQPLPTPVTVE